MKRRPKVKTAAEVRAEFSRLGMNFSEWARDRGYSPDHVHRVLSGHTQGKFGISHDIAVELGMKVGIVNQARRAKAAARTRRNG